MALKVYSKFYYGFDVTEETCSIDFKEGTTKKRAVLEAKKYTLTEYVIALAAAMNLVGTQIYTVVADRKTRVLTISAPGVFSLLLYSGDYAHQTAFQEMGFTQGVDLVGANSYVGEVGAGKEYLPQIPLQSYMPVHNNSSSIDAVKKTTVTGESETLRLGVNRFMECEIMFITDIPQPEGVVRSNPTGEDDARSFLEYATASGDVEFMEDESRPEEFIKITLESTEQDPKGLGYRLYEEYQEGMPDYYRSGRLVWRLRA